MLMDGQIDPRRYQPEVFADTQITELGSRINIIDDGNPDKNALGPQSMEIHLKSGEVLKGHCKDPLGSPQSICGIAADISARRDAEEATRLSNRMHAEIRDIEVEMFRALREEAGHGSRFA